MKKILLIALCIVLVFSSSRCDKGDPPNGHLKLSVTYPEAVVENGTISFVPVPGVGSGVCLYKKDASCKGYRDAMLDIAWLVDKYVSPEYKMITDQQGEVLFLDIPAGEYYLVVFAGQLAKYTEKYIQVHVGDTLILTKKFTPDIAINKDLEPWDYEVPGY